MGNQVSSSDKQCATSSAQANSRRREDETKSTDSSDGDSTMIGSHPSPVLTAHQRNRLAHLQQQQHQQRSLRDSLTDTVTRASKTFRDRCWKHNSDGHASTSLGTFGGDDHTRAKSSSNPNNVNISLTMSLRPEGGTKSTRLALDASKRSRTMAVLQDSSAMSYYSHATANTHSHSKKSSHHHANHAPLFPPRRSKSVPVKCPRRRTSQFPHNNHTEPGVVSPEGDDAIYLSKLYDSKTWELYRRITESRRKTGYNSSGTYNSAPNANGAAFEKSLADHNIPDWELDGMNSTSPNGGQEMIFMFDFD